MKLRERIKKGEISTTAALAEVLRWEYRSPRFVAWLKRRIIQESKNV